MNHHRCFRHKILAGYTLLFLTACLGQPVTQEDEEASTADTSTSTTAETMVSPFDVVTTATLQPQSTDTAAILSPGADDYYPGITGTIHSYQSADNFYIASTMVNAGNTSRIDDGNLSSLANGKCIEARGHLVYRQSRTVLMATRIKFKSGYCY